MDLLSTSICSSTQPGYINAIFLSLSGTLHAYGRSMSISGIIMPLISLVKAWVNIDWPTHCGHKKGVNKHPYSLYAQSCLVSVDPQEPVNCGNTGISSGFTVLVTMLERLGNKSEKFHNSRWWNQINAQASSGHVVFLDYTPLEVQYSHRIWSRR